tara:strand:+ start:533 stop:781 length:249 start_codon:yes stop_codon:yes gene_type:complete
MKKLIISVGALGVMSFTTNQLMNTYHLASAIDTVQDMKEYMKEDITQGVIEEVYGEYYIEMLQETEKDLIEYMEENRLIGDF